MKVLSKILGLKGSKRPFNSLSIMSILNHLCHFMLSKCNYRDSLSFLFCVSQRNWNPTRDKFIFKLQNMENQMKQRKLREDITI